MTHTDSPNIVKELLDLDREIYQLDKDLKEKKDRRAKLEEEAKKLYVNMGVQSIRLQTGETAYLRRQIFASKRPDVDPAVFIKRMEEAGLGDFVKQQFSPQQLSAYIREREAEHDQPHHENWDELLPPPLKGLVSVHEKVGISIMGAKSKR